MTSSKSVQLLIAWGAALLLSSLLVMAGQRWPDPLPIRPVLLWCLLLGPPGLLGAWLASRWRRCDDEEGQSSEEPHEQA
ncbi:hypothetical protein KQ313_05840 [Synechococcus sp. CS-1325]|uniref:hypothetical protein n=1 Tax=unclassified Synechococcus TaxID=2626047 RepID=UPI000DB2C82C|nr:MULTISPECIES: hypothetical protein [unclassified Synechococcus]PZV02320.1 MAG: hypothetical protein DCF24_02215 [Cyanobium sp.]MCT0199195.1 hypothetical protein [Synechococcus sp. CS-1325]MCT0214626.1 hypothetical protein [Synechococcus sp. CS-1326]MCT0231193.1 hypothetical protein [Synechococcus sp. CS-1324]MCT0233960.1 hypothetical protein [Synechococcus sp. CS-1327]